MAAPLTLRGIVRLPTRRKISSTRDSMTGCVW